MNRVVRVAATQYSCNFLKEENTAAAISLVRKAANAGAKIILLQELFETVYFCQEQKDKYFDWAHEETTSKFLSSFSTLAAELDVVLPVSFFERENNAYYNSIIVFDADGKNLGKYRKSHIPDGPGYQEKFYFTPGDTGFTVFNTKYAKLGIGICWDQWFPETARALVLQGAELLLYPTAIGSEPKNSEYDSAGHWQRTMIGHACANMVPVIASNRVGTEVFDDSDITFYGTSFICNHIGEVLQQADRTSTCVITADIDLDHCARERRSWGLFRDRRPELYHPLLTKDGTTKI